MEKAKVFDILNKFVICKYIEKLIKTNKKVLRLCTVFPCTSTPNLSNPHAFIMIEDLSSFVEIYDKDRLN